MPSLKEGAYNEEESHNGFLEALNAWRNAGKPEGETPKPDKKIKDKDIVASWKRQQDDTKKFSFLANIDGSQSDFNLGAIPTWQEGGT
jgi:hypothetical protein